MKISIFSKIDFYIAVAICLACMACMASTSARAEIQASQIAIVVDLDGNLLHTGSDIVLFHRATGMERPISASLYAKIGKMIGKSGEWENYELRFAPNGSFRYVQANSQRNFLAEHVLAMLGNEAARKEALLSGKAPWMGKMWPAWKELLSTPEGAKSLWILTGRGQTPEQILEAFRILQFHGFIRYMPEKKHLIGTGGKNTAGDKVLALRKILDVSAASATPEKLLYLQFSDDTWENIESAAKELGKDIREGKYPNARIEFLYTGDEAHSLVLNHSGEAIQLPFPQTASIMRIGDRCSELYRKIGSLH